MKLARTSPADYYDPREGGQPVRFQDWIQGKGIYEPVRTNYFAIYWIDRGCGDVAADDVHCRFDRGSLLFFSPYQYLRFKIDNAISGSILHFHANFLCVETFHAEVGCSGALFNDPYGIPVVPIAAPLDQELRGILQRIQSELSEQELAYTDAALAYLKILLIVATRAKTGNGSTCAGVAAARHPILDQLNQLIERNYRTWHSPTQYASALHMPGKTLGRIVRDYAGTTLTQLIRRRLLIHAKWQLLHTLRPVKEIAQEVGFNDELYFSRFFKRATGISPTKFRKFETEIRGGSNLSMDLSHSSIHSPRGDIENTDQ